MFYIIKSLQDDDGSKGHQRMDKEGLHSKDEIDQPGI